MIRTWFEPNIKNLGEINAHQVILLLSRQLSGSLSIRQPTEGLFNPTGKRVTLLIVY